VTKLLKLAGFAVLALVVLVSGFALSIQLRGMPKYPVPDIDFRIEVTPERIARGRRHAMSLCSRCHLDGATGAFTGRLLTDVPKHFGPVYSGNITQDRVKTRPWPTTSGRWAARVRSRPRPKRRLPTRGVN